MRGDHRSNLEFLKFLADISDPGTGEIRPEQLSAWLKLSPEELVQRWLSSGHVEWADFANDVLRVLDWMHDRTHDLSRTIEWYMTLPIASGFGATGDELVSMGRIEEALSTLQGSTAVKS